MVVRPHLTDQIINPIPYGGFSMKSAFPIDYKAQALPSGSGIQLCAGISNDDGTTRTGTVVVYYLDDIPLDDGTYTFVWEAYDRPRSHLVIKTSDGEVFIDCVVGSRGYEAVPGLNEYQRQLCAGIARIYCALAGQLVGHDGHGVVPLVLHLADKAGSSLRDPSYA